MTDELLADRTTHVALFTRTIGDCAAPPPPTLSRAATCGDAVALLRDPAVDAVVVADESGRPVGIVTEQDVVHRIAFRMHEQTAVAEAMSSPVRAIRRNEYLFQSIALMRRANLRHLPVVDDQGVLAGMVYLHAAIAQALPLQLEMVDVLTPHDLTGGIAHMKRAQVRIALDLLRDGTPATEVQALLTHFNNDIYRRTIHLSMEHLAAQGLGEPPAGFDVVVMGSGGRGESYLFPDQDNGFVIDDYDDADHRAIDAWFVALAEKMTGLLDEVGITLCKGFVMASNPLWRKTRSQWQQQVRYWIRRPSDATLRLCDIFFDFSPVFGRGENAGRLREDVTALLPGQHAFLARMQQVQRDHGVALGLFNRLSVDDTEGPHKGKINLKYHALLPLVESIRLLALREGVAATGTRERMTELAASGVLAKDEHDYLDGAFSHITDLVLRRQLADYSNGLPVGPYVAPDALTEREKDMLVDGLKAIDGLRDRLRSEFTGAIF